jgi:hypothetical protein
MFEAEIITSPTQAAEKIPMYPQETLLSNAAHKKGTLTTERNFDI